MERRFIQKNKSKTSKHSLVWEIPIWKAIFLDKKKIDTLKDKFENIKGADKFISSLKEKKIDILYQLEPDKVKSVKNMKDFIEKELNPKAKQEKVSFLGAFDSAWSSLKKTDKNSLKKDALTGTLTKSALSEFTELSALAKKFSLEKVRQEILSTTSLDDRIGQFIDDIGNLTSAFSEMQKMVLCQRRHCKDSL